ncbi:hypothetical protein HNQ56_000489 [Anaerotaenia torta]|uniref:hypothetical protein n=1 Tax=Anaerotaenia torta TaxID=433293 RepID=UPI003D1C2618
MSKKNIIIITICALLFSIIFVSIRYDDANMESPLLGEAVSIPPRDIITPTNTPFCYPHWLMINEHLVEVELGVYHKQISPTIQEKIDSSEPLGVTAEPVEASEFPKEEMQTNFMKKGCPIYYYKDDTEELYIFIDCDRDTYCYYVSPCQDTPTNPPDTVPPGLVLNGRLILLTGRHVQISPSIQEKIDAAELLGITVEPVSPSEFPTEELQTNYIKKGCSIYHYKTDSEEVYIFIDCDRTTYCFYNTPWE